MGSVDLGLPLLAKKQQTPEIMASHLRIGNLVEVVEPDKLAIVEGIVQDVRINEDIVVVQPISDNLAGISMLVESKRVRPAIRHSPMGHPGEKNFRMYDSVEVLNEGRWLVGVIVHLPVESQEDQEVQDNYRVRTFREDKTVCVMTDIRRHVEWDHITGWTSGVCKRELERLERQQSATRSEVGFVGSYKAKVVRYFSDDHMLIEFIDLRHADGTYAKEVINRKRWHKHVFGKMWEKLTSWMSANHDPAEEFACYMPAYVCLGILGLVTPVLLTDSARSWPDDMVPVFYSLGGASLFLCLIVLIGLMIRQPKTRAELNKWRLMCLVAVATGLAFMVVHAVYGRKDLVASRTHKS